MKKLGPEKIVEKEVIAMAKTLGMDLSIVDSKMVYSKNMDRMKESETEKGFSDLTGEDANAIACYIELKAPGKLKTIRPSQRAFLERKIQRGAFAVCVSSAEELYRLYIGWKVSGRVFLEVALAKI